jgi:MerR family transcriptional regulator, thiopeptide resistance regulator
LSKVYRVREFAELAGVTVKALHHYDRLGLLKPRRTDAGYRLYSDRDLERLEQIVALKFLGLPLKQIKVVLERSALELPDALRLQRELLEQKQQLLDRALRAIQAAELALTPGEPADPVVLKKLIEVIGMQDDIEVMKRYYSEQAWTRHRSSYEHGPSQEWKDLGRDVLAALGEDPAGEKAQDLAKRWMDLVDRDSGGDPEVYAGAAKAWADRGNWPESLRRRMAEYNLEAIAPFIGKAMTAHRKKHFSDEAWEKLSTRTSEERVQLSAAWQALWLEVRDLLGGDPTSEQAQALAARWMELCARSGCSDSEVREGTIKAWRDRRNRPEPAQRWSASFKLEQVAEFIGRANAHRLKRSQ